MGEVPLQSKSLWAASLVRRHLQGVLQPRRECRHSLGHIDSRITQVQKTQLSHFFLGSVKAPIFFRAK
jgi:hypothetical protein